MQFSLVVSYLGDGRGLVGKRSAAPVSIICFEAAHFVVVSIIFFVGHTLNIQGDIATNSPSKRARAFLDSFENAWNHQPTSEIVQNYFVDDAANEQEGPFWRDMVAFTWNICTNQGTERIQQALAFTQRLSTQWKLASNPLPLQRHPDGDMDFRCDLAIASVGTAKAHIRLSPENKIQTLLTNLVEIDDRPFRVGHNRIRGHVLGPIRGRKYWQERLDAQRKREDYVVIIGGGQAGLALGARLHLMDIPYTILEAGSQPGVAWRQRYPSLLIALLAISGNVARIMSKG